MLHYTILHYIILYHIIALSYYIIFRQPPNLGPGMYEREAGRASGLAAAGKRCLRSSLVVVLVCSLLPLSSLL